MIEECDRIMSIKFFLNEMDEVDGKFILKGWGYNAITHEPLEMSIIGKSSLGVSLVRIDHKALGLALGYDSKEDLGFKIIFESTWKNKEILLKLYSGEKYKIQKIKCAIKEEHKLRSLKKSIQRKLFLGKRYFDENGLKNTLKSLYKEVTQEEAKKYRCWIKKNESQERLSIGNEITAFQMNPKISIILPVYNSNEEWLKECIKSVLDQYYTNWELCIVDDHSKNKNIKKILDEYASRNVKIKVFYHEKNEHISKASNTALNIATGEYIALLDHDDVLSRDALYKAVKAINKNPKIDFIYTDEDKITQKGERCDPFFKPDWSPDSILSQNYICHLVMIRKTLVEKAGNFRIGFEGAQDYDLILRCTELTKEIHHIPEVLYHWRKTSDSTAENPEAKNYAFEAGKKAIESALMRRNVLGEVKKIGNSGAYQIKYAIEKNPKISIIIPTKDHSDDLEICLKSIIEKSRYENYEIIIMDNGSKEQATFDIYEEYEEKLKNKFSVLTLDTPFNFSELINYAARFSKGEYLVLLNNDTKIITEDWSGIMLGFAQQRHIGAVGVKLLYSDDTIQHAGVIIGIGGVAGHSHKHYSKKSRGYFQKLYTDSNYSAVTAACLMVEKRKFLEVNGFDEENLAIAFNDVDFCLKLLELGYYNISLSQVESYHYESKSRGKENNKEKKNRFQKEVYYMQEKWDTLKGDDPFYSANLSMKKEDFSIKG